MKKMPCLFVREFHGPRDFTLTEQVTPGCEWVLAGEGIATRKWDGTACMLKDGALFKRYDAKKDRKTGEYKSPPPGAIPCDDPDPVTGHWRPCAGRASSSTIPTAGCARFGGTISAFRGGVEV